MRPDARAAQALLLLAAGLLPAALLAQDATPGGPPAPRIAVVVQVAGSTLYLSIGTEDGLRPGDTVAVSRHADSPRIGALHVIGATARRAVVGFTAAPFPVTRGDTLYVTPRPAEAAPVAVAVVAAEPPARAPPPVAARWRSDGAVGLEMWGSHTETVGLGTDPARLTRDIGVPALRFRSAITGDRSALRINLRAEERTGPQTIWDRHTRLRIYEARYDLTAGRTHLTVGRFYSEFDHQSAFWDGASARVSVARGLSLGVAAGFEPQRGNEEVSFEMPKVAGFIGTRVSRAAVDLSTDLALTQTLPTDRTLRRTGADLALRLRLGRVYLSQDLEAAPASPGAAWEVSRFVFRGSVPIGPRGQAYVAAVTDRFTPLDTALLLPFARRDRVTGGYSAALPGGAFLDVNASLNQPSDSVHGYAAGTTVSIPRLLGDGTVSLHASWFDDGRGTGILASPAIEYLLGATRLRAGYQFYGITQPAYTTQMHGLDLRLWRPLGTRTSGVLQLNERIGPNLRTTTVFTSFEVRF